MDNILEYPLVSDTRRNHALEHATIHILSERFPGQPMLGHSNPTGFLLVGELPTEDVREAASEALSRLQNGEHYLAIHEGCGTNYIVTAGLAAIFAMAGLSGTKNNRERLERFPTVLMLSVLALMIGKPLGPALQWRVTTQPDPGDMALVDVYPLGKNIHRIITKNR